MSRLPVLLSWSSGKDSAWALHVLRQDPRFEVVGLLTTISEAAERVAMHQVRRQLVEAQAAACALPLTCIPLPDPCPNDEYEARMRSALDAARDTGTRHVAFGDLFLEDIRRYREERLASVGFTALFPLWRRNTRALADEMLEAGVVAYITSVDPRQAPAEIAGKLWSRELLAGLPPSLDPCGENGEFHSFVAAGPMLERTVSVRPGPVETRNGFVYADLLPS